MEGHMHLEWGRSAAELLVDVLVLLSAVT